MATTNSGFLRAADSAGAVTLHASTRNTIASVVSALSATRIDKVSIDLASDGFAKNGATRFTLSGTTPKTLDLSNIATSAASYAGDTTFSSYTRMSIYNDGAANVTLAPGGSNPATLAFSGLTLAPGEMVGIIRPSATTIDSTHKNVTITPAADSSICVTIGGA